MKEIIEKIVNAWWQDFGNVPDRCYATCPMNDGEDCLGPKIIDDSPYSFETQLEELLPEYHFRFDGSRWFIASEL